MLPSLPCLGLFKLFAISALLFSSVLFCPLSLAVVLLHLSSAYLISAKRAANFIRRFGVRSSFAPLGAEERQKKKKKQTKKKKKKKERGGGGAGGERGKKGKKRGKKHQVEAEYACGSLRGFFLSFSAPGPCKPRDEVLSGSVGGWGLNGL